ncbi:YfhL [Paenibacillus glucanolyticus]
MTCGLHPVSTCLQGASGAIFSEERVEVLESLSIGIVFILYGLVLFLLPPKSSKSFYAYKTTSSLKNERNFKAANAYVSLLLMVFGVILLLIARLTGHFLTTGIATFIVFILIYILVERKLKNI